ncbi:MAG: hypothetical protein A3I06_12845 [Candidatus Lindowbacteria bacterium RIFCSPLOWO2_02_FULL_62_12]|nr:MAG: hypothetical protein A3I06_12845 [Candidatus Lindowbacteria bacterium RIFCSPLOWO2_02_FULL_62_12]
MCGRLSLTAPPVSISKLPASVSALMPAPARQVVLRRRPGKRITTLRDDSACRRIPVPYVLWIAISSMSIVTSFTHSSCRRWEVPIALLINNSSAASKTPSRVAAKSPSPPVMPVVLPHSFVCTVFASATSLSCTKYQPNGGITSTPPASKSGSSPTPTWPPVPFTSNCIPVKSTVSFVGL